MKNFRRYFHTILLLQKCNFFVYFRLKKAIRRQAAQLANQKMLPEETGKYFSALEKDFDKYFDKIMKHNEKQLSKKTNGVSNLIKDYIKNYISDPKKLQEYCNLDMGSFYQNREKMYGLI